MKNITVSMPEDLAKKESRYQSSHQEFLAERPVDLSGGQAYPSRDSLYER